MITLGVDPHKQTHTAAAIRGGSAELLGELTASARPDGYEELLRWGRRLDDDRVWAIERHLEGQLAERDERIAALDAERDALRARIEVRVRAALGRVARRRPFPKP